MPWQFPKLKVVLVHNTTARPVVFTPASSFLRYGVHLYNTIPASANVLYRPVSPPKASIILQRCPIQAVFPADCHLLWQPSRHGYNQLRACRSTWTSVTGSVIPRDLEQRSISFQNSDLGVFPPLLIVPAGQVSCQTSHHSSYPWRTEA